jgi:hypothetical protein
LGRPLLERTVEEPLEVDRVRFATGDKVDLRRVPMLASGDLLARIRTQDGYPVLDSALQTRVPGLYMTSLPAVRASAQILGRALRPTRAA